MILSDIVYTPRQLGIQPETPIALTLANIGRARHTFNIDALDIHVEVQPGEMRTIVLEAPVGTYTFYCSVPGHRDAGMSGTLHVAPAYLIPPPNLGEAEESTIAGRRGWIASPSP